MKNKASILFLINNLSRGGAESVFVNDVNALSNLGFDCRIALLYSSKSEESMIAKLNIEKNKIWNFNFKSLYDLPSYNSLIKRIKKEKVDIVYSTLDDANFVGKVVRIFTNFKLFCREANMTEDKPIKFKIADVFLNFFVHKLVMVAEAVKNSYASYDPFHKSKMVVLYNGVDIPSPYIPKSILQNEPIKIIAVGSFTVKKGFRDLIEIFRNYIFPDNKNVTLEIIGVGHLFDEISSKIKEYKMDSKIKCLGSMDKKAVTEHYMSSDIFVLTSKKEGCPNVLLEAMSCSVTPVCFNVGAVGEIIENNISGLVIPKGDKKSFGEALNELLDDREKIKEIGKRAKERIISKFTFDAHVRNLLNVLELKNE